MSMLLTSLNVPSSESILSEPLKYTTVIEKQK